MLDQNRATATAADREKEKVVVKQTKTIKNYKEIERSRSDDNPCWPLA